MLRKGGKKWTKAERNGVKGVGFGFILVGRNNMFACLWKRADLKGKIEAAGDSNGDEEPYH